jgi:hypothetical protein
MSLTGWDLNQGTGSNKKNNFTKFPEGITRIRILDNVPFMRWTHWLPQFSRKITCPGFGCPIDDLIKVSKNNGTTAPYSSSRAFSLNIFNYDTNQREIMEEGVTMFEALKTAIEDAIEDNPGTNIGSFIFKVRKRQGASGRATWTVTVDSVNAPLSEAEIKAKDERVDLAELFKAPTIDQVHELLNVQASTREEYVERYNTIMGYNQQNQQDEGLGLETE